MSDPTSPTTTYVASSPPAIKAYDLTAFQKWLYTGLYSGGYDIRSLAINSQSQGNVVVPSATSPLLTFKDAGGNLKGLVDYNGYRAGRLEYIDERWRGPTGNIGAAQPVALLGEQWSYTLTAGATKATLVDPTSTYPARSLLLNGNGDSTVGGSFWYSIAPLVHYGFSGLSLVLEFEMFGVAGTNGRTFVGFNDTTTPTSIAPGVTNIAGFSYDAGNVAANWYAITGRGSSGAQTKTNTGIAVDSTVRRARIELYGSASPLGAATAIYWIDESIVATHTTFPLSVAAYFLAFVYTTASANDTAQLQVGPLRAVWNRYLTLPAL